MKQDIIDYGKNFGRDWPRPLTPIHLIIDGIPLSKKPSDITNEEIEKHFDQHFEKFPLTTAILARLYFNRCVTSFKFGR